MRAGIYQHFRPEEREAIDRASDWVERASDMPVLTPFLNPRERYIVETVAQGASVKFDSLPKGEYQRLLVFPDYYTPTESDFEVALLTISYPVKFYSLKHSQILGTILGETGLDRREIGDILLSDDCAQIFVTRRLVPVLIDSVHKIAGAPVKFDEVSLNAQISVKSDETKTTILLASLRLDTFIATALKNTRNFAVNMIQSSRVKVNYAETTKNDLDLQPGDLVSIKGFGRLRLIEILGQSKKNKLKVEIATILNHKK
ncbi:MAG: cell division protein [Streptococcaceae bacterium]|jgi:RNA-binding protein YlmH|nr:cell division protein [Streptococcaceae bacterium]